MKLNTNLLIGAALLGGGAYVAYHKGWFGLGKKLPPLDTALKANQEVLDKVAAEEAQRAAAASAAAKAATAIKQATTISNPKSYEGKVAYIQTNLGVAVDGKAGSQTNKAFAAIYGLDKGDISTANIDYYEARVKAKDTLAAKKAAAAVANAKNVAAVNLANDAAKFLKLVNEGNYKATLKNSVTANAFVYDNLKKAYVNVNEAAQFPKGIIFKKGDFATLPRGIYVLKRGANNKYFAISINDFLVTA
jgi:hypothetical protein